MLLSLNLSNNHPSFRIVDAVSNFVVRLSVLFSFSVDLFFWHIMHKFKLLFFTFSWTSCSDSIVLQYSFISFYLLCTLNIKKKYLKHQAVWYNIACLNNIQILWKHQIRRATRLHSRVIGKGFFHHFCKNQKLIITTGKCLLLQWSLVPSFKKTMQYLEFLYCLF